MPVVAIGLAVCASVGTSYRLIGCGGSPNEPNDVPVDGGPSGGTPGSLGPGAPGPGPLSSSPGLSSPGPGGLASPGTGG